MTNDQHRGREVAENRTVCDKSRYGYAAGASRGVQVSIHRRTALLSRRTPYSCNTAQATIVKGLRVSLSIAKWYREGGYEAFLRSVMFQDIQGSRFWRGRLEFGKSNAPGSILNRK